MKDNKTMSPFLSPKQVAKIRETSLRSLARMCEEVGWPESQISQWINKRTKP